MGANEKIYNYAVEGMRNNICNHCGGEIKIFYGNNHYDIRMKDCGNIICSNCDSGVVVTKNGLMYYFEKGLFKYGGNAEGLGEDLYNKI